MSAFASPRNHSKEELQHQRGSFELSQGDSVVKDATKK
jgi:hypothetical protein